MNKGKERLDRELVNSIKDSYLNFGQLYPILLDFNGEVIDGFHRMKAISEPKYMKLSGVRTKKDRLYTRLVANHARRGQDKSTWTPTLTELAELLRREGVEKIGQEIAERTGLCYRTILRYLPEEYKDSAQSKRASHPRKRPDCRDEGSLDSTTGPPKDSFPFYLVKGDMESNEADDIYPEIKVQKFSNCPWKAVLVPEDFMRRLEEVCKRRNLNLQAVLSLALLKLLKDLKEQ